MNLPIALKLHRWIGASVQRKLVLMIGLILAIVSGGFLLLVMGIYQNRLIDQHTRASMQVNQLLRAALENAMLKRDIPGLQKILRDLDQQPGIARVMILNPNLEVRFSSESTRVGQNFDSETARRALAEQVPKSTYLQDPENGQVLRSINPVHNQQPCQQCHGTISKHPINGLLVVDYDSGQIRQEALASSLKLGGIGLLVIFALSAGLWLALKRFVLTPLDGLSKATQSLARGDFGRRVPVSGHDEIARLAESFNKMSEELEASVSELDRSEKFLQSLIDAVPDGLRVIGADFRIIKANQTYCRMVGQTMDDVVGAKCYSSSHARDEPCPHTLVCCPIVELCQKQDAPPRLTCRDTYIGTDGTELFAEVSAARLDMEVAGNSAPCVVESIRDLAEQARLSQQQRLSEIGLLAAGVAHEIFNPLSSIDLALNALQTQLEAHQNDKVAQYFPLIRDEIQNCIRITDSLLLLSAPAGTNRQLILLTEVIPEVLALLNYEAKQRNVAIHHDIPANLRIFASDSDVRMLIVNLALNAIHAMPDGGSLTVTAERHGKRIMLVFADMGVGISPEHLDKIFLPFWSRRADSSNGRGLGLSIVKTILEKNGGEIEVKSTLGKGSRFIVWFEDADKAADKSEQNEVVNGTS